MAIEEEGIDGLVAVDRDYYKIDLTRDGARRFCERIAHLLKGLKRSEPPPDESNEALSS